MSKTDAGAQSQTWCRHYNGAFNFRSEGDKTCEAGVSYTSLTPRGPGWLTKLPCVLSNKNPVPCASFALYSAEEWEAKQKE